MNSLWARALGALSLLFLFAPAPARAEWLRAESPNFILYGNSSESALRARILLLEDYDRLLRLIVAVRAPPAPNKLHVYIVSGLDDLQLLRPVTADVAGLYTATPDGIAAFVDGRAQMGDNEILFHEYAHHFMLQHAPNPYPAWYVEGFAEYFMTARFTPRQIDVGKASPSRVYSIMQSEWLPFERILSGGTQGLSRDQRSTYYAQAWLLTHYFYNTPDRQAGLGRLLAALRGGQPREALQSAVGLTPEALTVELRRYIRGGRITFRRMTRTGAEAPPPVTVTAMPRSADDLILFEAVLRIGIIEANEQPYLQRIRTAAARHPDDPLAMRVLAHAELLYGDGAAADRLLDRLLAATPNNADLMYLKGMRHLVAAQSDDPPEGAAREARQWFSRAHRADANHFQTLYRYAQSLRGERNYVSENTSNVLVLAHQLAPQVSAITMNAAAMMLNRGEFEQAAALLRPLAVDPHDAGLARAAQQLLEQAQARARPGSPPPPAARPAGEPGEPAQERPRPPS
jgi:thioredoxin-like negative regulator of GroEL